MLDKIDFTDNGIFFIVNEGFLRNLPTYLPKFTFLDVDTFNTTKEVINENKSVIIPIDNINPKFKQTFEREEKEKYPYFIISKNKIPNYGYLILRHEDILKQERFNKIFEKHKYKYTKDFKKEITKEIKIIINELNEYNHYKTYRMIGFNFEGDLIVKRKNLLKNDIIKTYKENNTKKLFSKIYKEGIDLEKIEDLKYIDLKRENLLNILKNRYLINETEYLYEINFKKISELYSKEKFLEEFINDYSKNELKHLIKEDTFKWVNNLDCLK